ncbi:hypothetical protein FQA39_LY03657 [Lamprigera yunnana]|nr:hypothetical protein FQA39_LY03657 [Lamprigera yunnana]
MLHIHMLKNTVPNLPTPPQCIRTRWGTWIKAVDYYKKYYSSFKDVVTILDEEAATSIKIVKRLVQNKNLRSVLAYISSNYSTLPYIIEILQKSNHVLRDLFELVEDVIEKISVVSRNKGQSVLQKCLFKDKIVCCNPLMVVL